MSFAIPPSADFSNALSLPQLPAETSNRQSVVRSNNGSTYSDTQQVVFDLPQSGMLDPATLILRYKSTYTTVGAAAGGTNSVILGGAAYSPIARMETQCGSKLVQSIANYGPLYHQLLNYKLNVAQRCSAAIHFGWDNTSLAVAQAQSTSNLNGYALPVAAGTRVISNGLPIMNILSGAEKLVPLFALEQFRLTITLDSLPNYMNLGTGQTCTVVHSNFELVYDSIFFGAQYEAAFKSIPQSVFIKSSGWSTFAQPIAASAGSGNIDLTYPVRYSSARALFMLFQSTAAINKNFDTFDLGGIYGATYQWTVDSQSYPQSALDTLNNKAGTLLELKNAVYSSSHDMASYNMSILPAAWAVAAANATVTTQPSAFTIGTSLEKCQGLNSFALNGISTKAAGIQARISCNGASMAATGLLICCFDYLMVINPSDGTCNFES